MILRQPPEPRVPGQIDALRQHPLEAAGLGFNTSLLLIDAAVAPLRLVVGHAREQRVTLIKIRVRQRREHLELCLFRPRPRRVAQLALFGVEKELARAEDAGVRVELVREP